MNDHKNILTFYQGDTVIFDVDGQKYYVSKGGRSYDLLTICTMPYGLFFNRCIKSTTEEVNALLKNKIIKTPGSTLKDYVRVLLTERLS